MTRYSPPHNTHVAFVLATASNNSGPLTHATNGPTNALMELAMRTHSDEMQLGQLPRDMSQLRLTKLMAATEANA